MYDKSFFYYISKVLRFALYPFALIYGLIVWVRNKLYDKRFFSSIQFSIPVITVGNLSTGGTGKTPHVEYLVNLLQYRYKVATMSRGYKRRTTGFILADQTADALKIGDEPMQYLMKYPELVVSVAEDRLIGIPTLLQKRPDIDVIILDDAFQHRSVKAGLNILITDFSHPFYKDHVLPFGNLRESRSSAGRANVIIVSKCPPDLPIATAENMVSRIAPAMTQKVFFTGISYGMPFDLFTREPEKIADKNIVLVCCIANPTPLIKYLKQQAKQVHPLTYHDHHYFSTQDVEEIIATYANWNVQDKIIVTTEKDATRLHLHHQLLQQSGVTIAVLPIKVLTLFNQGPELDQIINDFTEQTIAENNDIAVASE